ncbi:hypothetical protein NYA10_29590, partial [Burkholderia thailandensis]|nr:hypothetical protein [Burkholderia thailandensis]
SSSVGVVNTAIGTNATASNRTTIAIGDSSTASGVNSVALGYQNIASADFALASGMANIAAGTNDVAMGENNKVYGGGNGTAVAVGLGNNIGAAGGGNAGSYSVVFGQYNNVNTTDTGVTSTALCITNTVSGVTNVAVEIANNVLGEGTSMAVGISNVGDVANDINNHYEALGSSETVTSVQSVGLKSSDP